jgi:hypothetical protein
MLLFREISIHLTLFFFLPSLLDSAFAIQFKLHLMTRQDRLLLVAFMLFTSIRISEEGDMRDTSKQQQPV